MNEAGEHIVVGEPQHGGQSGASSNEARDDSEDNDSSSDLGAKQENLIKRQEHLLYVIVVQVQFILKAFI